jgi:hypothetical protein
MEKIKSSTGHYANSFGADVKDFYGLHGGSFSYRAL